MIKILFICHGNICRSPMAEFIFKDLTAKRGLSDRFHIESAAVSSEEIGNPVYPPAKAELARHGIYCGGKTARKIRKTDYEEFDYLIAMEGSNIRNMKREFPQDPKHKIFRLLDVAEHPKDIEDPWYTRQFDVAYREIEAGCTALLAYLGFSEEETGEKA